jgi:hypothetical protein
MSVAALCISGCDELDKINDDAAKRPVTNNPVQIIDAMDNVKPARPAAPNNPATNPPATNTPPVNATTTTPPPVADTKDLQKADVGVGVQGKDYGGGALMAPITTPVREYFNMRDRTNFDMIHHDLEIYHAINNRYPKNMEEFKKEIIEPGNRELPELPLGDVYVYEAKTGELFVQHNPPKQ